MGLVGAGGSPPLPPAPTKKGGAVIAFLENSKVQIFLIIISTIAAVTVLMALRVMSVSDGKEILLPVVSLGLGIPLTPTSSEK